MKKLVLFAGLFCSQLAWAADVNVRVSPLSLLVGWISLTADFPIDSNWTAGPTGNYWNLNLSSDSGSFSDISLKTYSVGVRGNWFKNGVFTDGLYLAPSLTYTSFSMDVTSSANGEARTGSVNGLFAGALVGYGWFWENFNIMLGIGANLGLGQSKVEVTDSVGNKESRNVPTAGTGAEFTFGYTF